MIKKARQGLARIWGKAAEAYKAARQKAKAAKAREARLKKAPFREKIAMLREELPTHPFSGLQRRFIEELEALEHEVESGRLSKEAAWKKAIRTTREKSTQARKAMEKEDARRHGLKKAGARKGLNR